MPTKYRPSTGQEWQQFDADWCAECAKVGTCTILAEAAERRLADPNYPTELIVRNATPVCTAFSSARAVAS
ncbi:MAG: hypothetical protein AB1450_08200 [Pseudomonadota bacterium]